MPAMLLLWALSVLAGPGRAVHMEHFVLSSSEYPAARCNDGTQAGYFHDTDLSKLDKVHVHLLGGNLCDSDSTCQDRCDPDGDGVVDNHLCTADTRQTVNNQHGFFSESEENPLRDHWHVVVPYCSSDTWAGTGRAHGTGYYHHGKNIFRSVMNSLSHHFNLFQASELVLTGNSAGAFGVGQNCDDVADWLAGNTNTTRVACVADAPDFIPWWVHTEDCYRRQPGYQSFITSYWGRDMDHSCQNFALGPDSTEPEPYELCGILSRSLPFISSRLFVLVSLVDPTISRDYGCPEPGREEEVLVPWLAAMHSLADTATMERPEIGWFAPSCSVHGVVGHESMTVEDRVTGERLTALTALARWLAGQTVHAVDTIDQENPTCNL